MMKKTKLCMIIIMLAIWGAGCQSDISENAPMAVNEMPTQQQNFITALPTPSLGIPPIVKKTSTLDILYTQDNPVTDNQEIISILDDLLSRYLSQFSKPGWYHFPNDNQNSHWMHIPEEADEDQFDMFLSTTQYHTYAPGFIWPFSIVLQDGSWGFSRLSPRFNDYQFNQGGKQSEILPTLDNLDYFAGCKNCSYFGHTSLMDFVDMLNNPNRIENNVEISRTFSAWVEQDNGKAVFVLLIHETYPGMKPKLESSRQVIDRRDQYTYFDMDNGGRMFERSVYFLEDGEIDEGELQFNQHLVQYYEVLPEDIQAVYDEASQKLKDYLEEQ